MDRIYPTETLKQARLTLVCRPAPGEVILKDDEGKTELWVARDDYAGYTVKIGRWHYEFVRTVGRPGEGWAV